MKTNRWIRWILPGTLLWIVILIVSKQLTSLEEQRHFTHSSTSQTIVSKSKNDPRVISKGTYEKLLQKLSNESYVLCAEMVGKKLDIPWNEKQKFLLQKFQASFEKVIEEKRRLAANLSVANHSGKYKDQLKLYYDIVQHEFVQTVCETGFNGGHSTFMWLNSNPDLHVYSFDLGEHEYARPMANVLQKMFPGRLNVTFGDSRETLPKFHEQYPNIKCDLVIIDGGHTGNVPMMDFNHFYQMVDALSRHLLIVDDWPSSRSYAKDVGSMWKNVTNIGKAKMIGQCRQMHDFRPYYVIKGVTFGVFT